MPTTVHIDRDARERATELVHARERRDRETGATVSLTSVRVFLETVDNDFERWMRRVDADEETRTEWRVLALRNSLEAFVGVCAGSVPATATALVSAWTEAASMLGVEVTVGRPARRTTRHQTKPTLDAVLAFEAGVVEYAAKITTAHDAVAAIRRLMTHLRLNYDQVGRMVDNSGETVRRWEHGQRVPPEKHAVLRAADSALSRLLDLIRPEALPVAVRRPAEIFGNVPALEWILGGRIGEVADRYDRELSYQR